MRILNRGFDTQHIYVGQNMYVGQNIYLGRSGSLHRRSEGNVDRGEHIYRVIGLVE